MISLVIPAYNEEKRIMQVINEFSSFLSNNHKNHEIIIVANGCNDNTAWLVRHIKNSRIKLLEFKNRLGKGGAVIEGFKAAKGDIIAFVDSDLAVSPTEFGKLILSLKGCDCAIGSRRAEGAEIWIRQNSARRLSSRVFNIAVSIIFNLGIKDTQCGAKIFRRKPLMKILPKMKSTGYEFDVELLWRLKKAGCKIKEVPIIWKHQEHSKFSLLNAPKMFFSLLKLRVLG